MGRRRAPHRSLQQGHWAVEIQQEKLVCLHLLEGPLQVLCRMCQRSLTRLPLPHRWTVAHTGQFLLKEWFGAARVYDSEICGIGSGHPEQLAERAGNARWV